MCSTPEPMTTSWTPEAISAAPKLTACWAEPHWRSTVVADVSIGRPSCSQALRRDVERLLAELLHAAGDDVLDLGGSMPARLDHLGVGLAEQIGRVGVLVVALLRVSAPDRRADGFDDDDLAALLSAHGLVTSLVGGRLRAVTYSTAPHGASGWASPAAGAIACGLAAAAARHGEVRAVGALDASAERARRAVEQVCGRLERRGRRRPRAASRTDLERAGDAHLRGRGDRRGPRRQGRLLAQLARGRRRRRDPRRRRPRRCRSQQLARRLAARPSASSALHVFNPVPKMKLVELAFPRRPPTRTRGARPRAVRGPRQDAPSRSPTSRASSSTGCCSPTCSAPSTSCEETGHGARGDRHRA